MRHSTLLNNLVNAYNKLRQSFDDAQVDSMNDFKKVCWQPLVASDKQDPQYLIRFEFGEQRADTVLQVFNDNGQFEYIKNGKDVTETATKLLAEDEQNPWTKHAFGKWDIATMLSADSLRTPTDPKLGARVKKSSGKKRPGSKKCEPKSATRIEKPSGDIREREIWCSNITLSS